jgi:transposase
MILAVLLDGDGRPVCSEMWPGNTADVTTLIPVIDRLRRRFAIARVCVVADRGMISGVHEHQVELRSADRVVREQLLSLGCKAHQPFQLAARLQFLKTPERRDHLLTHPSRRLSTICR